MASNFIIFHRVNFVSAITVLCFILMKFPMLNSVAVQNICSLEDCKVASKDILSKMDKNIQPCDNFYRFVCGKYNVDSSPTRTHLDLYDEMRNNTQTMLISILDKKQSQNTIKPFRQISKLYKLCMNQRALIEQSAKPLREILSQLGGWPVLAGDKWNEKSNDWLTITINLIKLGLPLDLFLKFSIINSVTITPHHRIISLDRPSMQYNANNFFDDSLKNALKLGVNKINAEEELKKSRQLLIDLNKIIANTKSNTRVMKLNELSIKWPTVNWNKYFTDILSISSAVPIDTNDLITVDDFYIDELVKLMNRISSRVLMNYALSRVVEESLIYMRVDNITHLLSSRSKLCLNIIAEHLPNLLDAMFALNYVDKDKRDETITMVMSIKNEFIKIIEQADWLNNQTKRSAAKKLSSMSYVIGYLDEWKTEKWRELYNELELNGDNFFHCILNITRFKTRFRYQNGYNHIEDGKRILQMNRMPFYRSFDNQLIISAGFLQHLLFNNKLPKYMNYGRMGFFIGHEIIHTFDDINELIKINKNLMESSKNKFLGEATCLINQYSNYKVEEINSKLNGNLSMHENLADNSGVKLAYMAYLNWITQIGIESALPNLNYTPRQMFWINVASPWCTKIHPEILKDVINDSHSPAEFRIIGAVSNNENFSRDFKCPVGSKMNPIKKCTVW